MDGNLLPSFRPSNIQSSNVGRSSFSHSRRALAKAITQFLISLAQLAFQFYGYAGDYQVDLIGGGGYPLVDQTHQVLKPTAQRIGRHQSKAHFAADQTKGCW